MLQSGTKKLTYWRKCFFNFKEQKIWNDSFHTFFYIDLTNIVTATYWSFLVQFVNSYTRKDMQHTCKRIAWRILKSIYLFVCTGIPGYYVDT